ncbi:MAG: polysaccharide deacetylase family protein [candidate division KSB1 bacterium]|nr:polysaccharide deacetylase family protein [candidate division KSB1 bacterium]MDZ7300911.1 polysaccharide deacetylase family protein [candidate division KSB1 bacterium]MDZ7314063.1 polysaccharide deacetylase family protein [candidate division KSB1 bacterium]
MPPLRDDSCQHIPILLYHRVDTEPDRRWRRFCVSPENFASQMRWLAEQGFVTIHLGQVLDHYQRGLPVPPKSLVITFDDGYFCNYSRAFPILRQQGFVATVFLACNLLRREAARPPESRQSFMAWPEILEMQKAGWEFHSHGLDHRLMTELSAQELEREIGESKKYLAAELGRPVEFFCYPYAKFNRQVQEVVRAHGYRGACGGTPYYTGGPFDAFAIGRTEILWNDSLHQFVFKIRHGLNLYYYTRKQLGKIKRQLFKLQRVFEPHI